MQAKEDVNVRFYLDSPALQNLNTDFGWEYAQLEVIGDPSLNYMSTLSEERQTPNVSVTLCNAAVLRSPKQKTLQVNLAALRNITIQYATGREEYSLTYNGPVMKMYAYVFSLPSKFYEVLNQAQAGDTFDFLMDVDIQVGLKITVHHNGQEIIHKYETPDEIRLSKLKGVNKKLSDSSRESSKNTHGQAGVSKFVLSPNTHDYKSSYIYSLFALADEKRVPPLKELQVKYSLKTETSLPSKELALRRAARLGNHRDVEYLITHYNVDINGQSGNGFTALDWAYFGSHMEIVNTLCWLGADQSTLKPLLWKYVLDTESEWPVKEIALKRAVEKENCEDVRLLVTRYEAGIDSKTKDCTKLQDLLDHAGHYNATAVTSLLEELVAEQQAKAVGGIKL